LIFSAANFRSESGRTHTKSLGGAIGAIDLSAALSERFDDPPPFEFEKLLASKQELTFCPYPQKSQPFCADQNADSAPRQLSPSQ